MSKNELQPEELAPFQSTLPAACDEAQPDSHKEGRVLVVDDDEGVRDMLCAALSRRYKTFCAQSAEEAEVLLRDNPVHVIVCDHKLNGEHGLSFLERLRVSLPLVQRILITGHTEPSLLLDAINRSGVLRYLVKPVSIPDLYKAVETAMCEHASARQHRFAAQDNEDLRASLQNILSNPRHVDAQEDSPIQKWVLLLLGLAALALVVGIAVLLVLYYLKSALGIDIFPSKHLQDFL